MRMGMRVCECCGEHFVGPEEFCSEDCYTVAVVEEWNKQQEGLLMLMWEWELEREVIAV